VFKSTDGGSSWSVVSLPNAGTSAVNALAIDPATPTTLYVGTRLRGLHGSFSVFKSTDGGSTWSVVNTGLPINTPVTALAIDPTIPTTLYAGTVGVFKSTDGGSTWSAVNTGLTNTAVRALAIDPATPTTLYAGTDGGVFVITFTPQQVTLTVSKAGTGSGYSDEYPDRY